MNILVDGEIVLYGTVGEDLWGDGFTARDVVSALVEIGRETDVTVRINSGGGIALEGVAIFNALASHKGNVTVIIDGIAASAASVIAMGGDEIIMRQSTLMMIHDPASFTFGTADQHEKSVATLDRIGQELANIYAIRCDATADEMRELMKEETWFTADEAIEQGLVDDTESAEAIEATAFDYRLYSRAPEPLTALAVANAWGGNSRGATGTKKTKAKSKPTTSTASSRRQRRNTTMPAKNKAANKDAVAETPVEATAVAEEKPDARSTERARIQAITNSKAAEGRADLANHLAFNTDMTPEEAIAILGAAPEAHKSDANAQGAEPQSQTTTLAGLELETPPETTSRPKANLNPANIYANRRNGGQS